MNHSPSDRHDHSSKTPTEPKDKSFGVEWGLFFLTLSRTGVIIMVLVIRNFCG